MLQNLWILFVAFAILFEVRLLLLNEGVNEPLSCGCHSLGKVHSPWRLSLRIARHEVAELLRMSPDRIYGKELEPLLTQPEFAFLSSNASETMLACRTQCPQEWPRKIPHVRKPKTSRQGSIQYLEGIVAKSFTAEVEQNDGAKLAACCDLPHAQLVEAKLAMVCADWMPRSVNAIRRFCWLDCINCVRRDEIDRRL